MEVRRAVAQRNGSKKGLAKDKKGKKDTVRSLKFEVRS